MAIYYTMESVRDAILCRGGSIDTDSRVSAAREFPPDWNYCPCITMTLCERKRYCQVRLGIFFNDPLLGRTVIEVIYMLDRRTGFVRSNNLKLTELLDKSIIDKNALKTVDI